MAAHGQARRVAITSARCPDFERKGRPAIGGEHRLTGYGRAACGMQYPSGNTREACSCVRVVQPSRLAGRGGEHGNDMRQLIPLCALLLAACGDGEAARQSVKDDSLIFVGQDQIKTRLRDPDSAVFSGVYVSRKSGSPAICGKVNSRNGFGGMSGPDRFVTGGATAIEGDGTMDAANFQQAWDMLC